MEKEIIWSVHPARRDRRKFALFITSFVATLFLLYFAGGIFWMLFGTFILLIALYPFYVKTEYKASKDGIFIKRPLYKKIREWKEFRRIRKYQNGILLSPYKNNTFLENFRGEFLLVDENDKDKVLTVLKELLDEYGAEDKPDQ